MWSAIVGFFSSLKTIDKALDFLRLLYDKWVKFRTTRRLNKDRENSRERHRVTKQMENKELSDEELKKLHDDLHR